MSTPLVAGLTGWRRALVWAIAAGALTAVAVAGAVTMAGAVTDGSFLVLGLAMTISFAGVGALIATRQPTNAVGWLLFAAGIIISANLTGTTYVMYSLDHLDGTLLGTAQIAWFVSWTFVPAIALVGVYVPLLFPDGHPPSSRLRWRVFIVLTAVSLAVAQIPAMFGVGPLPDSNVMNPFGFLSLNDTTLFDVVNFGSAALAFPVAIAALLLRFRRGNPIQRQQLKWLGSVGIASVSMLVVMLLADPTNSSNSNLVANFGWIMFLVGLALIPVAIGVAILRYRLYEIDRLVSRTIAYAVVTGGLLVVYLAVNLALTTVFESFTNGNSVAVAASTLVVAALFTPLRRRVQRVVDRRFDRARYDAERTTAAFSGRLRNEVDLAIVAADLDSTVRASIAPSNVGVWLRAGGR
jgi:hypothetical protein